MRNNRPAKRSIFPPVHAWNGSGLDTGVWSNSAEEKYTTLRDAAATSGNDTAIKISSATDWKRTLRLHKAKMHSFTSTVQQAAEATVDNGLYI